MIRIYYSPYELVGVTKIQAKTSHVTRCGALLKIVFDSHLIGYADCHPWEEWGDSPLNEQLRLLSQGVTTPLTKRSLHFARLDAKAREKQINLFEGLQLTENHFLISDFKSFDVSSLEKAFRKGFKIFKVKMGSEIAQEMNILKEILQAFPEIRFRLDFNLKIAKNVFFKAMQELIPWKKQIDFVEDPFPFNYLAWKRFQENLGIALACDQQSQEALTYPEAASVVVIKPAIQEESRFVELSQDRRILFTSYLDHPLGQLAAAYTAAKTYSYFPNKREVCGLLSHLAYHLNAFSEQLTGEEPFLRLPSGIGFGFDALLERQEWQALF